MAERKSIKFGFTCLVSFGEIFIKASDVMNLLRFSGDEENAKEIEELIKKHSNLENT